VLSNRKDPARKGKVQLIDATSWFKPLRKNLGKKNCRLETDDIQRICKAFLSMEESEQSKVFPNNAFGYWKITVERPLRLRVDVGADALKRLRRACVKAKEEPLANLVEELVPELGAGPHLDFNAFLQSIETAAEKRGVNMTAKRQKLLASELGVRDATAAPVVMKRGKPKASSDADQDALYGHYHTTIDGKPALVEYEPDPELRDTEQVPFLEEGGIEAFFRREVLPHATDAWIDESKTLIGYEVSFTRYFYKPQPLRSLAEIEADIRALEGETGDLLEQIVGAA
jgi:type I restriction enzyme M protein